MPQPWLEVFKCLIQSHCTGWGHLNVYIRVTALAGGIVTCKSDYIKCGDVTYATRDRDSLY